ncbi:hypothetical protein IFM89_032353 [Coptis chinensis]|uniref:Methyltransferase n=1 Tax=Coptis chinensis TaxID=261450 RepID=A0A835HYL8_9MAGN|nr:hypothetical protein IFM89_032353 [Coptis chinensis]
MRVNRIPWHIEAMSALMKKMCWELVVIKNDTVNQVGAAIFRKPTQMNATSKEQKMNLHCAKTLLMQMQPRMWHWRHVCTRSQLMHPAKDLGAKQWFARAKKVPYWLKSSQVGVYGKAAPKDFAANYEHWKHVVSKSYLNRMGISWSKVRNVMDMRFVYGGWGWSTVRLNVQKFHLGGTPRKVLYHNESRLCPSQVQSSEPTDDQRFIKGDYTVVSPFLVSRAAFNALRLSNEWIFMSSSN